VLAAAAALAAAVWFEVAVDSVAAAAVVVAVACQETLLWPSHVDVFHEHVVNDAHEHARAPSAQYQLKNHTPHSPPQQHVHPVSAESVVDSVPYASKIEPSIP